MASRTYHHNKKTGVTHVYSVQSYWDKEKKAPRNRQVCLGRLDQATGEVMPSRRKQKVAERAAAAGVTASARVAGPWLLLEKLSQQTGLSALVMEDMETLVRITYSGRYGQLYTETSPIQRKIMEVFGLTLPA